MTDNLEERQKEMLTHRRLSLAKQLYTHGYTKSFEVSSISRMISILNFHQSLEILLRAIMLQHEIRAEKQMNIEFETMLAEIDKHEPFKQQNIRFPRRQELRILNQQRNHIQHHADEPEQARIEEWRVFTRQTLSKSFETYFGFDFEKYSSRQLVSDDLLLRLLGIAATLIEYKAYSESIGITTIAFRAAQQKLDNFLPREGLLSSFFLGIEANRFTDGLEKIINKLSLRIRNSERFTLTLASGINLEEYKKFITITPSLMFTTNGNPILQRREESAPNTPEQASWTLLFTENSILNWQRLGLEPAVPEHFREHFKAEIEKWEKHGPAFS